MTVEELTATVARYLGEERTRSSLESFAAARRISLDPKAEADFQLLRYAEHLLASAIGAASSRLVLSLLLRKRTLSTKAALKALDDANAAIHYNREILQTALDHVRQGIAVYDKDLQLICWNRQFGEILDLPPELTRVGTRARRNRAQSTPSRAHSAPDRSTPWCATQIERYVAGSEPFLARFAERGLVVEVRTNRMPDGGIVMTVTDITAERRRRGGAGARQRDAGNARARTHHRTDPPQCRARDAPRPTPRRPISPRRASSPAPATTSCSRSTPRASTSRR